LGAALFRPRRRDEPGRGPHLAPIRQRIESIFRTCKDILTLERHGARTIDGLRARVASRMLALAACVYVNWWLGRPTRSLVAFVA
jgi:Transposase DDE domain